MMYTAIRGILNRKNIVNAGLGILTNRSRAVLNLCAVFRSAFATNINGDFPVEVTRINTDEEVDSLDSGH